MSTYYCDIRLGKDILSRLGTKEFSDDTIRERINKVSQRLNIRYEILHHLIFDELVDNDISDLRSVMSRFNSTDRKNMVYKRLQGRLILLEEKQEEPRLKVARTPMPGKPINNTIQNKNDKIPQYIIDAIKNSTFISPITVDLVINNKINKEQLISLLLIEMSSKK